MRRTATTVGVLALLAGSLVPAAVGAPTADEATSATGTAPAAEAPAAAPSPGAAAQAPVTGTPGTEAPETDAATAQPTVTPDPTTTPSADAEVPTLPLKPTTGLLAQPGSTGGISPMAVPPNRAGYAMVNVRVGGDRIGGNTISATGLAGVELSLSSSAGDPDAWASYSWATCVSDAQGDCTFEIPLKTSGSTDASGMRSNVGPWVHQISAPSGWHLVTNLRTGSGNGTDSPNTDMPYVFRINQTLSGNTTYQSTSSSFTFMVTSTSRENLPTSAGYWQVARDNPVQPQRCGLSYGVLMDLSGSIGSQLPAAKSAVTTFIDALRGTPSSVGLFSFDLTSPASGGSNVPTPRSVRTAAEGQLVKNTYSSWSLGSGTNWDAGLFQVASAAPTYDVLVVLTDGNPTSFGTGSSPNQYGNNRLRDIEAGIFSANLVKAKGTRVVAVGVGAGAGGLSELNLQAISGPILDQDYFQVGDYQAAATTLAQLAKGNCEGSIDVVKKVVPASANLGTNPTQAQLDSVAQPAAGWQIQATSANTAQVAIGSPAGPWTTDADGHATVPLRFPTPQATGPITFTETQRPGYELQQVAGRNAVCVNTNTGLAVTVTNAGTAAAPGGSIPVAVNTAIECTIYNRALPAPATVTVTKQVTDNAGQNPQPAAGWTLGAATTATTGTVTAAPTATTQVTPASGQVSWALAFGTGASRATVAISETQQTGFQFQSGQCVVTPVTGSTRTVTLTNGAGSVPNVAPGERVACTIVNRPAVPALVVTKSANPASRTVVDPGATITYTLRFANTAGTAPAPVDHTDLLSGVLDDAAFMTGPTVSPAGGLTATRSGGTLAVTGSVPAGGTVTVSYTVQVRNPTPGDGVLTNHVVPRGTVPPTDCPQLSSTCTTHPVAPTLTLVKAVSFGSAPTSSWTLTAAGPSGSRPGPSGQHATGGAPVRAFVTANQPYQLSESGGPATYSQVGDWACVLVPSTSRVAPASGGVATAALAPGERMAYADGAVTLAPGANVVCTVTNATAAITLLKQVDGGSARPVDWNLTLTPATLTGLTPRTVPGADWAAGGNAASTVEVRPGHGYALSEALAQPSTPLAYRLERLERRNPDGSWTAVTSADVTAPTAGTTAVYRFVNAPMDPVNLPLTGGTSTDAYRIGGGLVLIVALGAAGWVWRRRTVA